MLASQDLTLAKKLNPSGDVAGMNIFSVDWPYCSEYDVAPLVIGRHT